MKASKLRSMDFYQVLDKYSSKAITDLERIPQDMLRYDAAFVNAEYPGIVAFITFTHPGHGIFRGKPTLGRWSSFGLTLTGAEPPQVAALAPAPLPILSEWVTYVHPRDELGAADYRSLIPTTLPQFLEGKL